MRDLTCTEVTDRAPGYALDILDAGTRDRVATHLVYCPRCRETVTDMQCSAAELLDLRSVEETPPAPVSVERVDWRHRQEWPDWPEGVDPPSYSDWIDAGREPLRPGRRRFRMAISLAAAALLLVGSSFGPEIEQAVSHPEAPAATLFLTAAGDEVGTVRIFTGRIQAMDIYIHHLAASGSLDVVVVDRTGTATTIGRLDVANSRGAWLGNEPLAPAVLASVLLVSSDHHAVASASLTAS